MSVEPMGARSSRTGSSGCSPSPSAGRIPRPSDGYTALYERGRLDLTVEALVLRPDWDDLFTAEDRDLARQRLTDYGLDVDAFLQG